MPHASAALVSLVLFAGPAPAPAQTSSEAAGPAATAQGDSSGPGAPAAAAPSANTASPSPAAVSTPAVTADPFEDVQLDPRPRSGPTPQPAPYSLELSEVEVRQPEATYRLTARRWKQMVREDPRLWHLHKRGRLVVPGAIFLGVSAVWLSISTAVAVDSGGNDFDGTATEKLFQWVFPSALLISGAVMTMVGVKARRDLRERQRQLYIAPYASKGTGGLTVGARF